MEEVSVPDVWLQRHPAWRPTASSNSLFEPDWPWRMSPDAGLGRRSRLNEPCVAGWKTVSAKDQQLYRCSIDNEHIRYR